MLTHEELRMPVLSKLNYQWWKFEVTSCLESVGVYEIVTGVEACPNVGTSFAYIREWIKRDAKTKRIISGGLNDEDHACIKECENSEQVWKKMKSTYKAQTESNKYLLRQALNSIRLLEWQSVPSYCAELTIIVQNLMIAAEMVADLLLIFKLMRDMPPKFTFRE